MTETLEFPIGAEVTCGEEVCGTITRVVIDPVARAVTHIVVEPKHRIGLGRLVPVELVEQSADGLRLRCTPAEFEALEEAEETHYLPGIGGSELGYEPAQVWGRPYYSLVPGAIAVAGGSGLDAGWGMANVDLVEPIIYDRIPIGEIDVRRGEAVHATDGDIGKVQGLVIDPENHHVTHVLLQEGHLWGKKEVAIPIRAVTDVHGGIQLSLSKDEVKELPEVGIDHSL